MNASFAMNKTLIDLIILLNMSYHLTSGGGSARILMLKNVLPPFCAFLLFKSDIHLGTLNSSNAKK